LRADYKELVAWQRGMELVRDVCRCTRSFPRDEAFGITGQMRGAAVSVRSNIAEGKGRFSRKDLIQFLYQARGSLMELERQTHIAAGSWLSGQGAISSADNANPRSSENPKTG